MKNVLADLKKAGIKTIDRRGKALGGNPRQRPLTRITKVGGHWTASNRQGEEAAIEGHESWWRSIPHIMGSMGGYHIFVPRTGAAIINYDLETQTSGVGNQNGYTVHVSYEGNPANPMTAKQRSTLKVILQALPKDLPNVKSTDDVWGHNEFPGHASNQCPGIDMSAFRKFLKGDVAVPDTKPLPAPSVPAPATLALNGVFYGNRALIAALQRHFGTPITGEITIGARSMLVEAMQRFYGSDPTGQISRTGKSLLWTAMQKFHGTDETGEISDSNSMLIKVVQGQLNNKTYATKAGSKPAKKTINQMADEIMRGEHGNGHDNRRRSLGITQAEYNKVHARVEVLAGGGGSASSRKTNAQIANDIRTQPNYGGWGTGTVRRDRLRAAGYDPIAIQRIINNA